MQLQKQSQCLHPHTRSSTTWTEQTKLVASAAAGDAFGISVAINQATAVIGAFLDDDNGVGSGSARTQFQSQNW